MILYHTISEKLFYNFSWKFSKITFWIFFFIILFLYDPLVAALATQSKLVATWNWSRVSMRYIASTGRKGKILLRRLSLRRMRSM